MDHVKRVLVTGGAGYVGSALVPRLLERGLSVRVLDCYFFGEEALASVADHPNLEQVEGDLREDLVKRCVTDCDAVIHLACISNDPSFDLDPELGRSINFDAFEPLVRASVDAGVARFIYASSSSVYGISDAPEVTEDHPLNPLTDYSKYKAMCEPQLLERQSETFVPIVIRPATLCGYAPRQRLDLTVNILTNHAINNGKITVFGGKQKRPNLHIDDMVDLYLLLLELPAERVAGKIFNAGHQNHTVAAIAEKVRSAVQEVGGGNSIDIVTTQTDDNRSYHISSKGIQTALGWTPKKTVEDAARELTEAFRSGKLPRPPEDDRYFNVKRMQRIGEAVRAPVSR